MIELTFFELILIGLIQAAIAYILVKFVFGKLFSLDKIKGLKIIGPLLMLRSKRGISMLDNIANRAPRFWNAFADLGIILGFGFLGAMYFLKKQPIHKRIIYSILGALFLFTVGSVRSPLVPEEYTMLLVALLFLFGFSGMFTLILGLSAFWVAQNLLLGQTVNAGVGPAIPGVKIAGSPLVIAWYGWFAFPILLFIHETSHGILSRLAKIKVKDAGLIFFGFLPVGAFVEPDEKELLKKPLRQRLRVFAAGSMANYSLALLLFLFLSFVVSPILISTGTNFNSYYSHVRLLGVAEDTPAHTAMSEHFKEDPQDSSNYFDKFFKEKPYLKLFAINGTETRTVKNFTSAFNATVQQGQAMLFQTDKGDFIIPLNENAQLGITDLEQGYEPMPLEVSLLWVGLDFLGILLFFNLVVGLMNLLPLFILDGGLMAESALEEMIGKKKAKIAFAAISTLIILFILVNMLPLFLYVGGAVLF